MRHCKKLVALLFAILFCGSLSAGIKKSDLKVLYVGGSPNVDIFTAQVDSAVVAASVKERMASFEKFLKKYFKSVTVVNAADYTPELSNDYDVTVMDGRPPMLEPEVQEMDAAGEVIAYKPAGYLPRDFDRPMLFIAEASYVLGARIGLKLDWYCLCLDADAHHIRTDHPIFQGPFPVKMTMVMKPTPEAGKSMPYLNGDTLTVSGLPILCLCGGCKKRDMAPIAECG